MLPACSWSNSNSGRSHMLLNARMTISPRHVSPGFSLQCNRRQLLILMARALGEKCYVRVLRCDWRVPVLKKKAEGEHTRNTHVTGRATRALGTATKWRNASGMRMCGLMAPVSLET